MRALTALQATALRLGGALVSPGGRRGSLLVLGYHRVLAVADPLLTDEPDAAAFAREMDLVRGLFTVIGLSDAVERLAAEALPPRAVAITFDDGYANNAEVAAPILATRGLTATFYVATSYLDGGRMWNDTVIESLRSAPSELDVTDLGLGRYTLGDAGSRRAAIDDVLGRLKYREVGERARLTALLAERTRAVATRPMMSAEQVRELLRLGMEVGAHSVTHPILSRIPAALAREEIAGSKRRLEEITGVAVRSFAYPNGRPGTDYAAEHVGMVREAGFSSAVSTAWGAAGKGADPWQIPRVAAWDRTPVRYGLRLLRGFTQRSPATV